MIINNKIFTKKQIQKCGKMIVWKKEKEQAISMLSEYRRLHVVPLNRVYSFLKKHTTLVCWDKHPFLLSQRLKRMNAIVAKIERNPEMNLARMQDIWWCRAIVNDISTVRNLKNVLENKRSFLNPPKRVTDYIDNPRDSWYRGIHLIYTYKTTSEKHKHLNWLHIEMQLRTILQHYWSTAVETVWIFTGESLKSSIWDKKWLYFFKLVSQAFAFMEQTALREDLPMSQSQLKKEITNLMSDLRVMNVLKWYASSISFQENYSDNTKYSLIVLDTEKKIFTQFPFTEEQISYANDTYKMYEQKYRDNDFIQVALLSTQAAKNLKKAYPNYFADTEWFINSIKLFLS